MLVVLKYFFLLLPMFMIMTASYEERQSSTKARFLEPAAPRKRPSSFAAIKPEGSHVHGHNSNIRNVQDYNGNKKQILTSFRRHSDQGSLDRPPGPKLYHNAPEEDRNVQSALHRGSQIRTFEQQQPRSQLPKMLNYGQSVDTANNNNRNYHNTNPSFDTQSPADYQRSSLAEGPRKYETSANHRQVSSNDRIPKYEDESHFMEERDTIRPIKYAPDGAFENAERNGESRNIQGRILKTEPHYNTPVNDPYPSRNHRQFHLKTDSNLQPEHSGELNQYSRHPSLVVRQPTRDEVPAARVSDSASPTITRGTATARFPETQYTTDIVHRQSNDSERSWSLDKGVRRPLSEDGYRNEGKSGETAAETEIDIQPAPSENEADFSGEDHDGFLDMGAYTDKQGSFGWYADFPVGQGHDKMTYSFS